MCNPTQNWSIFFLNVLKVNVQQNVQKNLNCPVKGSLKEIEYFTCPEYRRRILLIKDKFDEPAVLTLYVGNPPCTDFTGAGIAKLILSYLVKNVSLTKELIIEVEKIA